MIKMSQCIVDGVNDLGLFYMVCQPIFRVQTNKLIKEVVDYEILIRSKRDNRFPYGAFNRLIESELCNEKLISWFENSLNDILEKFPDYKFNINIDPQQFKFNKTWEFLERLSSKKKRVAIEITESIPLNRNFEAQTFFLKNPPLIRLKKLGFKTVLDDVDAGQNSLQLVSDNIENIDRLKISLVAFNGLPDEVVFQFLEAWFLLAKNYGFEFVVEGIDNEETVNRLIRKEVFMQQGFFWQRPYILK